MTSPVAGRFHRRLTLESVSATDLRFFESTLDAVAPGLPEDRELRLSWEQLRDYGCFPAGKAARERATQATEFGDLPGWHYTIGSEAFRMEAFFADAYPGLPMSLIRHEGDARVFTSRQLLRSDAPSRMAPEQSDAPAP
jgi:hypothetical protein